MENISAAETPIPEFAGGEFADWAGCPSESYQDGWRLMRSFVGIRDPAIRSAILDVVFVMAERDLHMGAALAAQRDAEP